MQGPVRVPRSKILVPVVVLMLTVGAMGGIAVLLASASRSSQAQLRGSMLSATLAALAGPALQTGPDSASSPGGRALTRAIEARLADGLSTSSQPDIPAGLLAQARADLDTIESIVARIQAAASAP